MLCDSHCKEVLTRLCGTFCVPLFSHYPLSYCCTPLERAWPPLFASHTWDTYKHCSSHLSVFSSLCWTIKIGSGEVGEVGWAGCCCFGTGWTSCGEQLHCIIKMQIKLLNYLYLNPWLLPFSQISPPSHWGGTSEWLDGAYLPDWLNHSTCIIWFEWSQSVLYYNTQTEMHR